VEGDRLADGLWKAGLLIATIAVVNMLWLSLGAALTQVVRDARVSRIVNLGFAALLLASVAFAVLG
ncbi:MAG: hypothetical protein AAF074_26920, partial [Pseudomonadota bacterium]